MRDVLLQYVFKIMFKNSILFERYLKIFGLCPDIYFVSILIIYISILIYIIYIIYKIYIMYEIYNNFII